MGLHHQHLTMTAASCVRQSVSATTPKVSHKFVLACPPTAGIRRTAVTVLHQVAEAMGLVGMRPIRLVVVALALLVRPILTSIDRTTAHHHLLADLMVGRKCELEVHLEGIHLRTPTAPITAFLLSLQINLRLDVHSLPAMGLLSPCPSPPAKARIQTWQVEQASRRVRNKTPPAATGRAAGMAVKAKKVNAAVRIERFVPKLGKVTVIVSEYTRIQI
jgi:hypothetical protein